MSGAVTEEKERAFARAVRAIAVLGRQFDKVCQDSGLSLPQYRLLLYVRVRPQRASELAERASVKRPTLTALVDGLVEAGLVKRSAVEHDKRGIRLELTPAGQRRLEQTEALLSERLGEFTELCDADKVLGGLSELARAIEIEIDRRVG